MKALAFQSETTNAEEKKLGVGASTTTMSSLRSATWRLPKEISSWRKRLMPSPAINWIGLPGQS